MSNEQPLMIRTVLDTRKGRTKYVLQVLLLVASWHRNIRAENALEVLIVGPVSDVLRGFFLEHGVSWRVVDPDPNDSFSATSNSICGATDAGRHRILLVDNDVVFRNSIKLLQSTAPGTCMGALPGGKRVTDEQWTVISDVLGLDPLPTEVVPLKEQVQSAVDFDYCSQVMPRVYVNGGVVLLPVDDSFGRNWSQNVGAIAAAFARHKLRTTDVYGSNMAGLAMAIAMAGDFQWLELRFNYRWACFALGLCTEDEISILHMTGFAPEQGLVSERIEDYWDKKLHRQVGQIRGSVTQAEFNRRVAVLESVRSDLRALVSEYSLDDWARRCELKPRSFVSLAFSRNASRIRQRCRQLLALRRG